MRWHCNHAHFTVPMPVCLRQAQLYSQHCCGMLLHAVALQPGTFLSAYAGLLSASPAIFTAWLLHAVALQSGTFHSAYAGLLSASSAVVTAWRRHAVAFGRWYAACHRSSLLWQWVINGCYCGTPAVAIWQWVARLWRSTLASRLEWDSIPIAKGRTGG